MANQNLYILCFFYLLHIQIFDLCLSRTLKNPKSQILHVRDWDCSNWLSPLFESNVRGYDIHIKSSYYIVFFYVQNQEKESGIVTYKMSLTGRYSQKIFLDHQPSPQEPEIVIFKPSSIWHVQC